MCGIAGIYLNKKINKKEQKELGEAIKKMNQSQKRRGPDDEGVFLSSTGNNLTNIALGHCRLSIIDLSRAGHQPMNYNYSINKLLSSKFNNSIKNNSLTITYNGEIYNFLELKNDLEKRGYKFKTKTDTEVILALYAEYGEKSFSLLRGMFAFGLYDLGRRKFFLVRDRYGIKPLYYYSDNEKIIFASTVKAIERSGLIPSSQNPEAFIGFLLFGSVPSPLTTIKNVFNLPVGHYLVREVDGKQKLVQYYEPFQYFNAEKSKLPSIGVNFERSDFPKLTSDIKDITLKIRELLEDSVKLHLISDAPLGVFLSGGLDSSAIAALAAKLIGNQHQSIKNSVNQRLKTLSIIFDEKEFSEEYYSDLVVQKIGSNHQKIKITKKDFFDSFDEIFEAMDEPTIDGVNTFFITRAAQKAGLKVVLSGLGGDEIFLGYSHFGRAEWLRKIQQSPLSPAIKLLNCQIIESLFGKRYSKLNYFANDDILSFYLGMRGLFVPREVAKILDINETEVKNFLNKLLITQLSNYLISELHPVDLLSYLEIKFYLENQLLKDTDFMSMHHSIEVRVPFLDHPLVEYLSSLPPDIKLNQHKSAKISINQRLNKPLLVEAVRDLLPSEIFTRSKMGFTFPFEKWLTESSLITNYELPITKTHWSRFWARVVLENWKS